MLRDLGLYILGIGVLLLSHEGFCLALHQEVEDNVLQHLVEKIWVLHHLQYRSPVRWWAICRNKGSNSQYARSSQGTLLASMFKNAPWLSIFFFRLTVVRGSNMALLIFEGGEDLG